MTKKYLNTIKAERASSNQRSSEEEDMCFEEEDYIDIERKNYRIHFHVFKVLQTPRWQKEYDLKNDKLIVSYDNAVAYEGSPPTKDEEKELFQAKCETKHFQCCRISRYICCNII